MSDLSETKQLVDEVGALRKAADLIERQGWRRSKRPLVNHLFISQAILLASNGNKATALAAMKKLRIHLGESIKTWEADPKRKKIQILYALRDAADGKPKRILGEHLRTHGLCRAPEYVIWNSMRQRCDSKTCKAYERYGGRGITVCERWKFGENGKTGFECFLNDMGPRPSKRHSIDRTNNNGNYDPKNCRWATYKEQANNKRDNVLLTFKGRTMTVTAWAELIGIKGATLEKRFILGWPVERALTQSLRRNPPIQLRSIA